MSILLSRNNNEVYYFAKKVSGKGGGGSGSLPYFPKHFPHYANKYLHMENRECGAPGKSETPKSFRA